jgi:3-oxoacyl-[acyl-carrier-protein] synthase III
MAFLEIKNVRIAGISAGVPKTILVNESVDSKDYSAEQFIAATGVRQKRYSDDLTTSDLCFFAAEKLIQDLGWQKDDIDALIFVSQTADYILPATACILQDRLKLNQECYAMDISLGCSGWVYGISTASSLLSNGMLKKALLMAGDARRRTPGPPDPLFGPAGTVTALEYLDGETGFRFHFGTDGSGFDAIIIPDGGSRNRFTEQSLVPVEIEPGIFKKGIQTRMKGMDVFSFGITKAPQSVRKLLQKFDMEIDSIDYFVFHQANLTLNEKIRTKLKLPEEKVPYSIGEYGNTSSASIPITIVTQMGTLLKEKKSSIIACGFGVGLSWGTVDFTLNNPVISELVEV